VKKFSLLLNAISLYQRQTFEFIATNLINYMETDINFNRKKQYSKKTISNKKERRNYVMKKEFI